ncbi:MAG: hypothetical protein PWQ57_2575 [Desulfovibrionales bacterium]|jgi:hypothetical protein|nr:hypothetical protein [Desulfovibrionales bacterium]
MKWLLIILLVAAMTLWVRAWLEPEPRPDDVLEEFDFDEAKQQES